MVEIDTQKQLGSVLLDLDFDVLLIDLIDERFDLFEDNVGGVCTVSNELLSSGFALSKSRGRLVKSGSDEFFCLWETGWKRLIERLGDRNAIQKLCVNEVYWARVAADGQGFLPTYDDARVCAANELLARMYARMKSDIRDEQFLRFSPASLVGAVHHRWGRSPFHLVDHYYSALLEKLCEFASNIARDPASGVLTNLEEREYASRRWSDRRIIHFVEYSCTSGAKGEGHVLGLRDLHVATEGEILRSDDVISVRFAGADGIYQLRFPHPPINGNGFSVRFRLRDWGSLRYVAVGYTHEGSFRHVKIVNAARGDWVDFSAGHNDLAFRLQNDWAPPPQATIGDIRLYLKGAPSASGAWVDVESAASWLESELPDWAEQPGLVTECSPQLLECVYQYLGKCFPSAREQALAFLVSGKCPLYGDVALEWRASDPLPAELQSIGTYRFSWHSLHPAVILLMHARESGEVAPLFSARDLVSDWLTRSYFLPDPDKKFAWYDHGTAERLLAMVLLWAVGLERHFDRRFMQRLRGAIFRHGQLLSSEAFYASHQATRYHNHAWFQDIALIAAAMAMHEYPCAKSWLATALSRLTDQFERLITRDGDYAVFVENSFGYHLGVQRLVEFAGALVSLAGIESSIPAVAEELGKFSKFLRYPDNRAPAQGDTFRRGNASGSAVLKLKPFPETTCSVLPKAGYAIVKGNHEGARFMVTMFATSLCRTHKHEDDLSFTLHFDGLEWLIDPSFYSHEYAAPIPAYLRSAVAHNVLALPGRRYSIEPGASCLDGRVAGQDYVFFGRHTAYDDVLVERQMQGRMDRLSLDVQDRATARASDARGSDLRLMLHCGDGVKARAAGNVVKITHPDSRHSLELTLPSAEVVVHHGLNNESAIRGITGLGFMKCSSIDTIECVVPFDVTLRWSLRVAGTLVQA